MDPARALDLPPARRPFPGTRQPGVPPACLPGAHPRYPVPDRAANTAGRSPALGAPGRLLLRRGKLPELSGPHDRQALPYPTVRGQEVHYLRHLPDRLRAADELAGTVRGKAPAEFVRQGTGGG